MNAGISVEDAVTRFLAHKRALGRKYNSEERELKLLSRFAAERDAGLGDLTPALLQEFLGARPRSRPRSFNHLLGVTSGLFRWAVAQEIRERPGAAASEEGGLRARALPVHRRAGPRPAGCRVRASR